MPKNLASTIVREEEFTHDHTLLPLTNAGADGPLAERLVEVQGRRLAGRGPGR